MSATRWGALAWVAASLLVLSGVDAQPCPNQCSGRGVCNTESICECYGGFWGPDCSLRRCALGPRWWGKSNASFTPHELLEECSGVGVCDSRTGVCACSAGYSGTRCERMACRSNCNSLGQCVNIVQLQELMNPRGAVTAAVKYANWDAAATQSCWCDDGWLGLDCAIQACPFGDDPNTRNQQQRTIRLLIDVAGIAAAADQKLRFWFNGHEVNQAVSVPSLTTANCAATLTAGLGIDATASRCVVTAPGGTSVVDMATVLGPSQYEVVLALTFPQKPAVNHWATHDGNPPLSKFGCYWDPSVPAATVASASCTLSDVDVVTMVVDPASDPIPTGTTYTVEVSNAASVPTEYTVTKTVDGSPPTITTTTAAAMGTSLSQVGLEQLWIKWNAAWGHTETAQWTLSSDAAGATVVTQPGYKEYAQCSGTGVCDAVSGTCSCYGGHMGPACEVLGTITSDDTEAPILDVVAQSAGYTSNIVQIRSRRPLSANFNFLAVSDALNPPFFKLTGSGKLEGYDFKFERGGSVEQGLSTQITALQSTSLSATPPLSVYYGSKVNAPVNGLVGIVTEMPLSGGGFDPLNYAAIKVAAATTAAINSGYTDVFSVQGNGRVLAGQGYQATAGGISVLAGGVDVVAGITRTLGGLYVENGATVGSGGFGITGGFSTDTITVSGISGLQGLVTMSGGVEVASGGATVTSGGLTVTAGGLDVAAGGLQVDAGGLSVFADGFLVQDSLSLNNWVQLSGSSASAASFMMGTTGTGGDFVRIEGQGSGAYNLLSMVQQGALSLMVTSDGQLIHSGSMRVGTASQYSGSSSAQVRIEPGFTSGAIGGNAKVVGGASDTFAGGDAVVIGGISQFDKGGGAYLRGGPGGTGTGGDVILIPGTGVSGNGKVLIKDASSTTRMSVDENGDITFFPASGAASIVSSGGPMVTQATLLSLTATTGVVLRGDDGVSGSATNGGIVSIRGGDADANMNGGSVYIAPGYGNNAVGSIQLMSSTGAIASNPSAKRLELGNSVMQLFSDSATQYAAFTHGATPAASDVRLAGTFSVGGATSIAGALQLGNDVSGTGSLSVAGALSVGTNLAGNGFLSIGGATSLAAGVEVAGGLTMAAGIITLSSSGITGAPAKLLGTDAAAASGGAGGSVSLLGGDSDGSGTGGNVGLVPGAAGSASNKGGVQIYDADNNVRLAVKNTDITSTGTWLHTGAMKVDSGNLMLLSSSHSVLSGGGLSVAGATTLYGDARAAGSLSIGTSVKGNPLALTGVDAAGSSGLNGGDVTVTGGTGDGSGSGGNVQVQPGSSSGGGTAGTVQLKDASGTTKLAVGTSVTVTGDLTVATGSFTVSDATKTTTVAGTLDITALAASSINWCTTTCPTTSLAGNDPSAVKVKLYLYADFGAGALAVSYGGTSVNIAEGQVYAVWS